jgi:hypothetical protein
MQHGETCCARGCSVGELKSSPTLLAYASNYLLAYTNDYQGPEKVRTSEEKRAALHRHVVSRLIVELALPLGAYYG